MQPILTENRPLFVADSSINPIGELRSVEQIFLSNTIVSLPIGLYLRMVGYAKFRVVRYQNSWIRAGSVACIIMWGGIAASFSKKDV